MPFLIDGHNLIPHTKGISLQDTDDESELLSILADYFKRIRKKAFVFFDRGFSTGNSGVPSAFVKAHFVKPPLNADKALIQFLTAKKKAAKNYTVVTSDREIVEQAQKLGAHTISSSTFAGTMNDKSKGIEESRTEPDNDIEYWMKIFGEKS